MKRILIGAAIGAGIAILGYKLYQDGKLDCLCDDLNELANKTKKNLKNAVDVSKNQVEYLADRAEYGINKVKDKFHDTEK